MLKKENVVINCEQCLCIKNGQNGSFCVSVPVHDEVTGLSGKASIQCSVSPDSHQVILENWLPINGKRYTWICEEDGRIEGAASAKGDVASTVWQIDYLQVDDEERCVALLETAGADAAERGVRKLFLYLDSTGTLSDVIRRVGFTNYKKDYLYRYCGQRVRHAEAAPNSYRLRSRNPADDLGLFQLYNATTPMPVRTTEGLTLEEWRESVGHGL